MGGERAARLTKSTLFILLSVVQPSIIAILVTLQLLLSKQTSIAPLLF